MAHNCLNLAFTQLFYCRYAPLGRLGLNRVFFFEHVLFPIFVFKNEKNDSNSWWNYKKCCFCGVAVRNYKIFRKKFKIMFQNLVKMLGFKILIFWVHVISTSVVFHSGCKDLQKNIWSLRTYTRNL